MTSEINLKGCVKKSSCLNCRGFGGTIAEKFHQCPECYGWGEIWIKEDTHAKLYPPLSPFWE